MAALQAATVASSLPATLPLGQLPATPAMAFGGFFLVFALFFLVFAVVLPLWVYSDAHSKGNDNAVLWALIVFLAPLLGLVLYLLLGDEY